MVYRLFAVPLLILPSLLSFFMSSRSLDRSGDSVPLFYRYLLCVLSYKSVPLSALHIAASGTDKSVPIYFFALSICFLLTHPPRLLPPSRPWLAKCQVSEFRTSTSFPFIQCWNCQQHRQTSRLFIPGTWCSKSYRTIASVLCSQL